MNDWKYTLELKKTDNGRPWTDFAVELRPCEMDEGGYYPITKRWGSKQEDYWGFCNKFGDEVRVIYN